MSHSHNKGAPGGVLRHRDGHEAKVRSVELFFDLVYVFAVTQLSHKLLGELSVVNAAQTLILWFGMWLVWQYTCWVTNWFDPERLRVRLMIFGVMLGGMLSAVAIPQAFGSAGLLFAFSFIAMQIGRTLFVLAWIPAGQPALRRNFGRILAWVCVSGVFWVWGGYSEGSTRMILWAIAVACEYISPMFGFRFPGLGRSETTDWSIEGGHLAERCQLFVIVALGETILVTGASLAHHQHWDVPLIIAFLVAFIGSLAMWWVYFDTSSEEGTHAIVSSDNPGAMGAFFHYVHVALVGAIIVSAVGNELALEHPDEHISLPVMLALVVGPFVYLLANGLYKRAIYRRFPLSHLLGLVGLVAIGAAAFVTDRLMVNGLTTVLLVLVAVGEGVARRRISAAHVRS